MSQITKVLRKIFCRIHDIPDPDPIAVMPGDCTGRFFKWPGWGRYVARGILIVPLVAAIASPVQTSKGEETKTMSKVDTLTQAVDWLQSKSTTMIRGAARKMNDGTTAFPPDAAASYQAFWLRDYAYMLEGRSDVFSETELKDGYRCFIKAQREDGAMVDCVKFDGTPCYMPGYGGMGANPVADGSQFALDVAWHTWERTGDKKLIADTADKLIKAMNATPRDPTNGLVYVKPGPEPDRCPYGFTDSIRKQGDELFCSILYAQASRQLSDLLNVVNRKDDAKRWKNEADRVKKSINTVFWDPAIGLYNAATIVCKQPDIWGSAFAVYIGVADKNQSKAIATYFKDHYKEIVKRGQLRHLPGGMYWEATYGGCWGRDVYQNGAYWATPVGWFVYTLDLVDRTLADQTVVDMVNDFITTGDENECINDGYANVPHYMDSVALPLDGIRAMQKRRK